MRSRTRLGVVALVVAAALAGSVVLEACSLSGDDRPRGLAVSTTTTQPAVTPTSGGSAAVLYFVRDGRLVPVARSLPDHQVNTVLSALLEMPEPVERINGLGSSIPAGTELVGLQVDGDTMSIDLSDDFENVVGPARQQAIGQMVLTATEFPEVRSVRFLVDGKPVQVTSPTRGDTGTVTACDYEGLLPTAEDVKEADLDAATADRLEARRASLDEHCPSRPTTRS